MEHGKFSMEHARRGYRLNKMFHSLNVHSNRETFLDDEADYCRGYGLDDDEVEAVISRNKPRLFELGGNMYFVAKLDRTKKREGAA